MYTRISEITEVDISLLFLRALVTPTMYTGRNPYKTV
jgi:hypothetical protein